MNLRLFFVFSFVLIATITFQQCSLGGEGDSFLSHLPSQSPQTGDAETPTLAFDKNSVQLGLNDTSMIMTGSCNTYTYANYTFEFVFAETGKGSLSYHRINAACVNKRFSVTLTLKDLEIVPKRPGVLSAKIIAILSTGEREGSVADVGITWENAAPPPPPPPPMSPNQACNCQASKYLQVGSGMTEASCTSLCISRDASCCELEKDKGACWTEHGHSCTFRGGFNGWSAVKLK